MRRFLGVGFVVVVIFGFVMVAAAEDPRQATGPIDRAEPTYVPSTEAILIDEGFEVAVPPPLWSWQGTHAGDTTWHQGLSPASGTYNANCLYDPALVPQDEWIVSEAYDLASGVLSFWSMGSLYWCRDDFDNCDLEIWLVVGGIGGGDDILLGTADVDWAVSYTLRPKHLRVGHIPSVECSHRIPLCRARRRADRFGRRAARWCVGSCRTAEHRYRVGRPARLSWHEWPPGRAANGGRRGGKGPWTPVHGPLPFGVGLFAKPTKTHPPSRQTHGSS